MENQASVDWIASLYSKRAELENRLSYLKSLVVESECVPEPSSRRPEGEFRYLELPVKLDNVMRGRAGPISTTELTNLLVSDRKVNEQTWILTNRNVSRLLNSRVKMGIVRKLGRVQGANGALLWEWIE